MSRAPLVVRAAHAVRLAWRVLTDPMVAQGFGGSTYKGTSSEAGLYSDWIASILHPSDELRGSISKLRARGRDIARNTGPGARFTEMFVTNIVGHSGFACRHKFRGADGELVEDVNKVLDAEWYRFWEGRVTLDGRQCGVEFLQNTARTWVPDGETFMRKWYGQGDYGLALEPIDADRVDETYNRDRDRDGRGEIQLGIEFDELGRRVAYYVLPEGAKPFGASADHKKIPASEIHHLFIPRRINQPRAVTLFAPVIWAMRTLAKYQEAELFASLAGACFMGFFEQTEDLGGFDFNTAVGQTAGAAGQSQPKAVKLGGRPASFEVLAKGLKLNTFKPEHPTTAHEPFVKSSKRDIASGLNCSYNIHANDGEGISYSTGRIFENADRDSWRVGQFFMARQTMDSIHDAWLEVAVMSGKLKLGTYDWKQFRPVDWMPRGWKSMDQSKDVDYFERALALGITNPFQVSAELGFDFEENLEQKARAKKLAAKYGVSIEPLKSTPAAAAPASDTITNPDDPNYGEPTPRAAVLEALGSTNGRH